MWMPLMIEQRQKCSYEYVVAGFYFRQLGVALEQASAGISEDCDSKNLCFYERI